MKLDIKKGVLKSALPDENMELVVPEGVTEVKGTAHGIKKAVLPDSLLKIGAYAFYFHALDEITIPAGVISVGSFAFDASSSLGEEQGSGDGLKRVYVSGTLGSDGNLGEGAFGFHNEYNPCFCIISGIPCAKLMKRLKDDGIISIALECTPEDITASHRINAGRGFMYALEEKMAMDPAVEKAYREFILKHVTDYEEYAGKEETVKKYIDSIK